MGKLLRLPPRPEPADPPVQGCDAPMVMIWTARLQPASREDDIPAKIAAEIMRRVVADAANNYARRGPRRTR